jgi:hypothetical protein
LTGAVDDPAIFVRLEFCVEIFAERGQPSVYGIIHLASLAAFTGAHVVAVKDFMGLLPDIALRQLRALCGSAG